MTTLSEDLYGKLLDKCIAQGIMDRYSCFRFRIDEMSTIADANVLSICDTFELEYSDRKAAQFFTLADYSTFYQMEEDYFTRLTKIMGSDYDDLTAEQKAEIKAFFDDRSEDYCDLREPSAIARYVVFLMHRMEGLNVFLEDERFSTPQSIGEMISEITDHTVLAHLKQPTKPIIPLSLVTKKFKLEVPQT